MKKVSLLLILVGAIAFSSCEEDTTVTGNLVVNLPGFTNTIVGLYDPASVTPNAVFIPDALYIQSFNASGKATFSNVLPGNYIVVSHENISLRKGAQVIAGETITISL